VKAMKNIFKKAKEAINTEDLISITVLEDENKKQYYNQRLKIDIPHFDTIKKGINFLEENISNFYFSEKGLFHFFYFKMPVLIEIHSFDIEALKIMNIKENIAYNLDKAEKMLKDKNFKSLFLIIDQRIVFSAFKEYFNLISNNEKFDVFMRIYINLDYGFHYLDNDFIEEIFSFRTEDFNEKLKNDLKRIIKEEDIITIYRGESTESKNINEAFSWTTDINIAAFFATRFNVYGRIYKAKIKTEDIINYIDKRDESEIIIKPKDLIDVENLNLLNSEVVIHLLERVGLIDVYSLQSQLIKPYWFVNAHGIHGVRHAKRVLLLNLILAFYEELDESDIEILCKASLYHDIGRINDYSDPKHGQNSIKKVIDLKLNVIKDKDENKILFFIIENHHIPDNYGLNNIKKYNIHNKERAIRLYNIFKDADGLDRVRIRDLDTKHLRLETSKKLLIVAYELLLNIV
jgi:HD-GYP domain-containing protein (c-di-GMP phosphodiesterase class II)